ncbi:MAG: type IV pilin protein [Marinagarivorans sp.]|nr:type IV pilin protein [Marinagarivorans sp.]
MVNRLKTITGFTLIEMMIVVVIIGILAAIAVPSYQEHIRKTRRVDARETLTRIATLQERFFFQTSKYSASPTDFGGPATGDWPSPEGWYKINLALEAGGGCAVGATPCNKFKVTATAIGVQASDTKCATFSIDQTLKQTATGTDANNCW